MTETQVLPDGQIKVCVETDDGLACGYVNSHDLVDSKARQLQGLVDSTADLETDPGEEPVAQCCMKPPAVEPEPVAQCCMKPPADG